MRQAPLLCWHLSQQWGNSRKKRASAGPLECQSQRSCLPQADASPLKLSAAEAVGPALPGVKEVQLQAERAVLPEEREA